MRITHKIFFVSIVVFISFDAACQRNLPPSILQDLLKQNDGHIELSVIRNDEKVEQFKDLRSIACQFEFEEASGDCPLLSVSYESAQSVSSFSSEAYLDGELVHFLYKLYSLEAGAEIQLWQVWFAHFPNRDEMIEFRLYMSTSDATEGWLCWKTDLFGAKYFAEAMQPTVKNYSVYMVHGNYGLVLDLGNGWNNPEISISNSLGQALTLHGSKLELYPYRYQIDTSGLNEGLYFFKLNDGRHTKTMKLYLQP
jgi:hypothetical protein